MLSPLQDLHFRRQICLAYGLADVKPFAPFSFLMASFFSKAVTLSHFEVVALALPAPTSVFKVSVEPDTKTASAT